MGPHHLPQNPPLEPGPGHPNSFFQRAHNSPFWIALPLTSFWFIFQRVRNGSYQRLQNNRLDYVSSAPLWITVLLDHIAIRVEHKALVRKTHLVSAIVVWSGQSLRVHLWTPSCSRMALGSKKQQVPHPARCAPLFTFKPASSPPPHSVPYTCSTQRSKLKEP